MDNIFTNFGGLKFKSGNLYRKFRPLSKFYIHWKSIYENETKQEVVKRDFIYCNETSFKNEIKNLKIEEKIANIEDINDKYKMLSW